MPEFAEKGGPSRPVTSPAPGEPLDTLAVDHDTVAMSSLPTRPSVTVLEGIGPLDRAQSMRDVLAGITLAALAIPEVMGYTKISGTPVVSGLYTILLPAVAFALLARPAISSSAATRPRRRSCTPASPR